MLATMNEIENLHRKYKQLLTFGVVKQPFYHIHLLTSATKMIHSKKYSAMAAPSSERVRN